RLRVVRVVSRDAAARYKGKRLPDIARGLEVDAVVEGGLQVSGGRVRVDLRLVDAASGYQLWADRFEEPVDKRFALADRSASGILSALKLPLSPAQPRGLRAAPTHHLQAYDLYLRGRIRARHESRQATPAAQGSFQRAAPEPEARRGSSPPVHDLPAPRSARRRCRPAADDARYRPRPPLRARTHRDRTPVPGTFRGSVADVPAGTARIQSGPMEPPEGRGVALPRPGQ